MAENRKAALTDVLCLALITILSAAPYITKITFYSDDWTILAAFRAGRTGLGPILADFPARPVQGAYLALLFNLFGLAPLGYHLVNTAVIAASIVLFYLLLIRLGLDRAEAFASSVILIVLPQLSTVRVWMASAQVPLSMLASLCSMHAQLSFMTSRKPAWAGAAAFAALVSVGAYETFAPLLISIPVWLALVKRGGTRIRLESREAILVMGATIALAVVAKALISGRARPYLKLADYIAGGIRLISPRYDWRVDFGPNILAALDVYVWQLVRGWALAGASLLHRAPDWPVVAVSFAAAAITLQRLRACDQTRPLRLATIGLAVFILGHALFLVVGGLMFSPTGMANRVSVAAAPGLAMLIAAAIGFAASRAPDRVGEWAFAGGVTLIVALGTARLENVESYWVQASAAQKRVLEAARRDLATIPAGSTIILDGVCPYRGPGVVFETWWDTGPALQFALGRKLHADAVSERMKVTAIGLETSIYGEPRRYAYASNLFVWDAVRHKLAPLPDARAAESYFGSRAPARCPQAYVGQGELI